MNSVPDDIVNMVMQFKTNRIKYGLMEAQDKLLTDHKRAVATIEAFRESELRNRIPENLRPYVLEHTYNGGSKDVEMAVPGIKPKIFVETYGDGLRFWTNGHSEHSFEALFLSLSKEAFESEESNETTR